MNSRTTKRNLPDPKSLGRFVAPRTEAEYDRAVELLSRLLDQIGDNSKNLRQPLLETFARALVEVYDAEHHEMPDVSERTCSDS